MNFGATQNQFAFGRSSTVKTSDGGTVPQPMTAKVKSLRFAAMREAKEVLQNIPADGEQLHGIMTGRYDLADMLEILLAKLGQAEHVRIATLSFNGRNVESMRDWLTTAKTKRLTILVSEFFEANNTELFQELREVTGVRLAASRNHCKIVCLWFADGSKFVIEGSANLRTNSNREQFFLARSSELHDWHAKWIDEQVKKHEVNG